MRTSSRRAEGVDEAVVAPDPVAEIVVEVPERAHRVPRRVGEGREGRGRRDHAEVLVRRVGAVALRVSLAVRPQQSGP